MLKFIPHALMSSISIMVLWILWTALLKPHFHAFPRALKSTLLMGLSTIILANVPMWASAIDASDSFFHAFAWGGTISVLVWGTVTVGFAIYDASH